MKQVFLLVAILIVCLFDTFAQTQTLNEQAFTIFNQKSVSYPITFAVLGDLQPKTSTYDVTLSPILSEIREKNPDLVICVGDLTDDGSNSDFTELKKIVSPWMGLSNIPFFSLPGNHDIGFGYDNYKTHISRDNELNYFFDYGHTRFILIDNVNNKTFVIPQSTLDITEDWLTSDQLNSFVFAHVPLYEESYASCGLVPGCTETLNPDIYESQLKLHNIFKTYKVRASIAGHKHAFMHRVFDDGDLANDFDVESIVTGGAGEVTNTEEKRQHWTLFTIDECGSVFVEVNWLGMPSDYLTLSSPSQLSIQPNISFNNSIVETSDKLLYAGSYIKNNDTYVVEENVNVKFVSGGYIKLNDGFHAKRNSHFVAKACDGITIPTKSAYYIPSQKTSYVENKDDMHSDLINFEVFPNPNNGSFIVENVNSISSDLILYVYNSLGILVYESSIYDALIQIDLSDQTNGIFLLKITDGENTYREKIIKQ